MRAARVTAAVGAALLLTACPTYAADRPNVVLIISDDQGWTDFGFMGHPVVRTPHLDRLASQGLVFPNGYVTAPLCRPSLASIMSGMYGHQTKICCNDPPKGAPREEGQRRIREVPTIPRLLAGAGYRSLQTGKLWDGHYSNPGFTDGMTVKGRHGEAGLSIGREGIQPVRDFIESCGDRPFFVWYAPMMPHEPHTPPPRILNKYRVDGRNEKLAKYYAMCEWFDETCGELLDYLEKKDLRDRTLVVFVTDNGWIQETGPVRRTFGWFAPKSKTSPYDGGVRTPIIVSRPGRIKPGRSEFLASSIDLAPTILKACGVAVPKEMSGLDLVAAAAGGPPFRRDTVFGEVFEHTEIVAGDPDRNLTHRWLRHGPWKLICPQDPGKPVELYDVVKDPTEEKNLAELEPQRVQELLKMLDRWYKPAAGTRPAG